MRQTVGLAVFIYPSIKEDEVLRAVEQTQRVSW